MEKYDAVGGAANVGENAPIAGASNGSLAGHHAAQAIQIADVAADRSVKPQDRGETIEDIISELNATSRSAVPPPTKTLPVPAEESDKDSTCDRKTESITSSGCGADVLEDDIENSGVEPEQRSSEMEDDFIVADEASGDEVATVEDSAAKNEKEEDHVPLPAAPGNNTSQEENEGLEAAVSSEKAADTVVAKTAEVTQLNSEDKSTAGSLESSSVEESKMPSVPGKPGGNAPEAPGTPRRTGRQRNAPQRLVDSTEKHTPERRHNGHEKPPAEGLTTASLTVDTNSHAEAVLNGSGSPVGQTNKTSPKRQHLTKAQRKLMIEDEAPALTKQTTPRKRVNKLALEESAVPSEASSNVQAEIFSDDDVPLAVRKTKASPRSKSLAKGRSQLQSEDQTSASPKRGTPRKRAAKPVVEQVFHEATTNGDQPDILSDDDRPLTIRKARGSPRAKQPSTSPKRGTPGKRAAKATVEEVLLAETTGTGDQAGVFSDEDVPLAKRGKKPSPKGKTPKKVRKQLALEELPPALSKRGAQREHTAKLAPEGGVVPSPASSSSLQPDLLSEDDIPIAVRKTKASPKKQMVKVREQLALEEEPQAPSSRPAPRKRLSNADADLEVQSSPGIDIEVKTRGKRQRTTADKDLQVSAAPALETQSNGKQKASAAKAKRTAAKSAAASKKTTQINASSEEPIEEPMAQLDIVQEEQDILEADTSPLEQEHQTESSFSSSRPRCIPAPSWRVEEFVSSDRLLRETVSLGLRGRDVTAGPAFLTIEVPSAGLVPKRCWGPKSARRRPTVVFGGCDPYNMYVNVHGTRVLLQQWSRAANITPSVRLTDMFAAFSSK